MPRKSSKTRAKARKPSNEADVGATLTLCDPNELLLVGQVVSISRMSRWTLRRLADADKFPKPLRIGFKRIAWRAAEVEAWRAGTWTPPSAAA